MKMNTRIFFYFLLLLIPLANCGGPSGSSETGKKGNGETAPAETNDTVPTSGQPAIVFFGNSLSAGYGLADPPTQSFPGLIQARLDSLGYPYRVVNAGISGETSSGGLGRIDWLLSRPVDIFVLELGGNDGLRGIPPAETKANLQAIIDKVKSKYPQAKIILAGMEAPPNMGPEFTSAFRNLYPELAEKNDVTLIPFLLEGVGGEPALNQADGIHPNVRGARIVADNVWRVLEGMLSKEG